MVYNTYLWWFGGWFIILLTTLIHMYPSHFPNIWWPSVAVLHPPYREGYLPYLLVIWRITMLYRFSPPAWGLLDFIRAVLLLLRLLRLLLRLLRLLCLLRLLLAVQIPVGTAGPPPRAPDPSGHCRTSTASCRSQWALPDLNRDFQVAVGTAGPQPRLPDRSGHCRTSTATSRSQWALPGLNGKNVRKDVR